MSTQTHFQNLGFSVASAPFHQAEVIAECLGNVSRNGPNRIFSNREIDQVASCTINKIRDHEASLHQNTTPRYV